MKKCGFLIVGVLTALLVLEIIFRCFPVSLKGVHYLPVNVLHPLQMWEPNKEYTYSKGWNFRMRQHGRINAQSYASSIDYKVSDTTIAVIGDSYIESLMLASHTRLQEQLQNMVMPKWSVYGFGRSGADAGEYVAISEWVSKVYHPRILVILLTTGDIANSGSVGPGGHYFSINHNQCELKRKDRYDDSWVTKLMKKMSLYNYLMQNLGFKQRIHKMVNFSSKVRDIPDSVSEKKRVEVFTKCFLQNVTENTGVRAENIVLIIDADRKAIQLKQLPQQRDIDQLVPVAKARGFQVIQMQKVFEEAFLRNPTRFDFSPVDSHWNEQAHKLAALEVAKSLRGLGVYRRLK